MDLHDHPHGDGMVSDDQHSDEQQRTIHEIIGRRLRNIRTVTGIPLVFGGSVEIGVGGARQIVVAQTVGAVTDSLEGLKVQRGLGLGGAALAREEPLLVRDYATCRWITHDYDVPIVKHERITSMVAVPVTLDDTVRGVVYAATRAPTPIGEHASRLAVAATDHLQRELKHLFELERREGELLDDHTALNELATIIDITRDPRLKAQLERVLRRLSPATEAAAEIALTPREIEVLALVATGSTNVDAGARLGLSSASVKTYVRNAMRKLDVHTRTAAVHAARRSGLL